MGRLMESFEEFKDIEGRNRQSWWTPSEARLRTLGYTHGHPPIVL